MSSHTFLSYVIHLIAPSLPAPGPLPPNGPPTTPPTGPDPGPLPPADTPTESPTSETTDAPTESPASDPTSRPTFAPTEAPASDPTSSPTDVPTFQPIGQNPGFPTPATPTCAQECIDAVWNNCVSNTLGDNGAALNCLVDVDSDVDGEGEGRTGGRLLRARIQDLSMTEDDVLSKPVSHQLKYHSQMIHLLDELLASFHEQM